MLTALALGDTSKRQRKDPLYMAIEDAASSAGSASDTTNPNNIAFVKAYCAHTAHPCIASWTTNVASLTSLTNEQFFNERVCLVVCLLQYRKYLSIKNGDLAEPPRQC